MRNSISAASLLHSSIGDVDGSGGFAYVPEASHRLCSDYNQIHCHRFSCLLV